MKNALIRSLALLLLAGACAACSLVPTRLTSIDAPGAVSTHPRGINNAGQSGVASVVGYYVDAQGTVRAFKRDPGTTFVPINVSDAIEVKAFDINNVGLGSVVGTVRDGSGQRAFLWDGSTVSFPGNPPVPNAFNINNTRRMVGTLQEPGGEFRAFYLTGADIASAQRIDIPGASRSDAYGINDAADPAQVRHVGTYTMNGVDHGFVHTQARGVETFDFPGAQHTRAFGINDAGEIVGEYVDSAGRTHGFIGTFQ